MPGADTTDVSKVTVSVSGLANAVLPLIITKLEHDPALQAALANALWPGLLAKMVLYFRNNPPAAAVAPAPGTPININPFKH